MTEEELLATTDWQHRLWPRANNICDNTPDGEWDLAIRGTEEEFIALHNWLIAEGYVVEESERWEIYTRSKLISRIVDHKQWKLLQGENNC